MFRRIAAATFRRVRGPTLTSAVPRALLPKTSAAAVVFAPRRPFHSSSSLCGWNQHVAFGVGIPVRMEDVSRIESAVPAQSGRLERVVVSECVKEMRVAVHSGGLMIDPDRCSKWVQHDPRKHGRVLVFDRNLHWIEEYRLILPADELIGPFDSFVQLTKAIGLDASEAAAVWTSDEADALSVEGSMDFEAKLGLSRSEDERRAYPYRWWAAAANVWAD